MSIDRIPFFQPKDDSNDDLFRYAEKINISIVRAGKNKVAIEYKLEGSIWPADDDEPSPFIEKKASEQAQPESVARRILRRFVDAAKQGGDE